MKTKQSARTVSEMAVLNDIRGLLSGTRKQALSVETRPQAEPDILAERARFEEQLKHYDKLFKEQQTALDRLEAEKAELDAKLRAHQSSLGMSAPSQVGIAGLRRDISDLEARKAELSSALSQIESILQFKVKELARRIARVYQEAGDVGASQDFRRMTDQIEAAENFGEFVRALARE